MTDVNKEDYPQPILIEDLGRIFATENSKQKRRYGIYKCGFCGTNFKANTYDINNGHSKSCGCYVKQKVKEVNTKHGLHKSKLYKVWVNIKRRTLNPKHKQYINYGGRGITICDEWKNDFMPFYNWALLNGYEENKGLSIDRIDNNGDYCPENCRWVDRTIQRRNTRIAKNNTSGFKGVCLVKKTNKYMSYITVDKNRVFLGYFQTAVEGAIAYNNYIIENNLEGFILNEIPEEYLNQYIKEKYE